MIKKLYHITPSRNLESIFQNGLECRNNIGICTLTTNNQHVVEYVTEMMLVDKGDKEFAILCIDLLEHNISEKDITPDITHEFTVDYHRYIKKKRIFLKPENQIQSYIAHPFGMPNSKDVENKIESLNLTES